MVDGLGVGRARVGPWAHRDRHGGVGATGGSVSCDESAGISASRGVLTGRAPPSSAAAGIGWATFVGAAIAGASALLSWVDTSFSSVNGFDVPAAFLVDYETGFDSGFSVGLVALVLAAAAMLAAVVRQPAMRQLGRVAGSGLVAVGVLFVVQLYRLADASDVSMSDLLGVAPFAAIVGGVTVLVAKGR